MRSLFEVVAVVVLVGCRAREEAVTQPPVLPIASADAGLVEPSDSGATSVAPAMSVRTDACVVQTVPLCELVKKVRDAMIASDLGAIACLSPDGAHRSRWLTRLVATDAMECRPSYSKESVAKGDGGFVCTFDLAELRGSVDSEDALLAHLRLEDARVARLARELSDCGALKGFETDAALARVAVDPTGGRRAPDSTFSVWTRDKHVHFGIGFAVDPSVPEIPDLQGRLATLPHRPSSRLTVTLSRSAEAQ